jgi:hypothetical protein
MIVLFFSEAPKREVVNDQIRLQDAKNTQVLDMAHQNALSKLLFELLIFFLEFFSFIHCLL